MRKILVILLAGFILLNSFGIASAQEDDCTGEDCEECGACRNNNFYYVLTAAIIVCLVFFYLRNRHSLK